ncbi:hypothetical protein ATANTOWER_024350 [Ataeniobius toweri]|uniref:Secreted protein n=1 Tax=Ataeniobius toweri TaxID=208326 RepID=A0ABU7C176_9TELE|nr:hypothetical protein [Ataeniobius toweri]
MVLSLPSSTTGFFVAVLQTACSMGASGLVILLDSGSRWDVLLAIRLNSVSAQDNLRAARLNSGFSTGRPSGRLPELCFVAGPGFVRVLFCFWPYFGYFFLFLPHLFLVPYDYSVPPFIGLSCCCACI